MVKKHIFILFSSFLVTSAILAATSLFLSSAVFAQGGDEQIQASSNNVRVLVPGWANEDFYTPYLAPSTLRIGPNDEVLLKGGTTGPLNIYQLHENGDLSIYASFSDFFDGNETLLHFDFDPSGNLWISVNGLNGGLYRVVNGTPVWVAQANPLFAFNSQGIMYAVGFPSTSVQRITPAGQVTVIAEGLGPMSRIAIGPNDEVLVVDQANGELLRVFDNGNVTTITAGLTIDHSIVIAPDGTAYLFDWSGLQIVDLTTGVKTPLSWYDPYAYSGERADFDSIGRMYTFHPNMPVYRLDLNSETSEMMYHPRSDTWAMAVGPDSRVFAAWGGEVPGTETTLYEVTEGNVLIEKGTVPYRSPASLAFGPDGMGYLAVRGPKDAEFGQPEYQSGVIYSFDPVSSTLALFYEPGGPASIGSISRLIVDPTTGYPWWVQSVPQTIMYRNTSGQVIWVDYPNPDNNANPTGLSFGPDGTLYALLNLPSDGNVLWHQRLHKREPDGTWTELFAADGPEIGFESFATCPNDITYFFGHTWDASAWHPDLAPGLGYLSWTYENENLSLFSFSEGDPFVTSCDPLTNDVYVAHTNGISRYYQWVATDFVYLPCVLKN